jgi:hypothetical protein
MYNNEINNEFLDDTNINDIQFINQNEEVK